MFFLFSPAYSHLHKVTWYSKHVISTENNQKSPKYIALPINQVFNSYLNLNNYFSKIIIPITFLKFEILIL